MTAATDRAASERVATEVRAAEPEDDKKPTKLEQLRARYSWLDHLVRAGARYTDHHGDHYAAAITFFSILSLVPLLMIAFAVAGFILRAQPELLEQLKTAITTAVPGGLGDTLTQVIDQAIAESRAALKAEPQSTPARNHLFEALRQKVLVLQETVALMNEMRRGNSAGAAQIIGGSKS